VDPTRLVNGGLLPALPGLTPYVSPLPNDRPVDLKAAKLEKSRSVADGLGVEDAGASSV